MDYLIALFVGFLGAKFTNDNKRVRKFKLATKSVNERDLGFIIVALSDRIAKLKNRQHTALFHNATAIDEEIALLTELQSKLKY